MSTLLVVGGGLCGSQAAAYARRKGIAALVFDAGLEGAASPAAAGLFKEGWISRSLREHYHQALPILEQLYGIRSVALAHADGVRESFLWVPPTAVLEANPVRERVTAVGDGWLEAAGRRYEGWVYVAAGVWCERLFPGLGVYGKSGSAFVFAGEGNGCIRPIDHGRQAIAFAREPGTTYFSDGTAEREYSDEHERETLARAAALGLQAPVRRLHGHRPYAPGGPLFRKIGARTWVATGGRKLGTVIGAAFARRLVEEELR